MHFKPIIFVLLAAFLLAHETEGHLKLKLLKAKLLAAKAPHVLAHIKVAKEVKATAANAFIKTLAAAKAARIATFSLLTAPIRVAAKTVALKVGAVKAAKALKVAGLIKIADSLKKNPIIVPVPVPVKVPFPSFGKEHALGAAVVGGAAGGILSPAFGPVGNLFSGAQNFIKTAGSSFPSLLPSLPSLPTALSSPPAGVEAVETHINQEPIYRFIPNTQPGSYNNIQYNPTINIDLPSNNGHQTYSAPASQPPVLHDEYGLPHP